MADGLIEDKTTVLMDASVGSAQEEKVSTSQSDDDLMLTARKLWRRDMDHAREWMGEARDDFGFAAGHQYPEGDESTGPRITFDRLGPVIDAVSGLEIQNRQEVRFIPRTEGDVKVNELLTSSAEFFRDQCKAEDEDTDAFRDTAICGMGWTEARLDFDEDPEGKYILERRDPLDMLWDASARARNLSDSRRFWHVREYSLDEAEEQFPDFMPSELHAGWASELATSGKPDDGDPQNAYRPDGRSNEKQSGKIRIVHFEWCEKKHVGYRTAGDTGPKDILPEEYDGMEEAERPKGVKLYKKVWYHAFLGSVVLSRGENLNPNASAFTCITGKRDHNKGTFYGIIRLAKDPQRWANRFMSQSMQIMNVNAKGGVMAKRSAFENDVQAQATWADPTKFTWLAENYEDGAIKEKPSPVLPNSPEKFLDFAVSAIRDTSGVNMELLGLRDANQAGVLEAQRKQAGMTILAHLFDNLRRYRKDTGETLLFYITNFLSDGRLVRIVGEEEEQYVPLIHQDGVTKYDVIVDDAPTSPNQKEMVWATVLQLKEAIPPQVFASLMKYSPLPSKIVQEMSQSMEQAQAAQAEQAQAAQQLEAEKIGAEVNLKNAQAEKYSAESQGETVDTQMKVMGAMRPQNPRQGGGPGGQPSGEQGGRPDVRALAADIADLEQTMMDAFRMLVSSEYAPEVVRRAPDGTAQSIQKVRPQNGF